MQNVLELVRLLASSANTYTTRLARNAFEVRFTELQQASGDRKQLARQLHSEVVRLKEAFSV